MFPGNTSDTKNSQATTPLRSDNQYVIGVDIGGTNLRLALADLTGSILQTHSESTVGIGDAHTILALVIEGVNELLRRAALLRHCLVAIAVGVPGVIDVDNGLVVTTSYLHGWRDVPLRSMLSDTLRIPAFIDNDVNLAALAESRVAARPRDFVFLALGTGVGAGIILGGKVFRGLHWTAGEIGYMLVPGTSVAPLSFDVPGALEDLVGGEGIRAQWHRYWSERATRLPQDLTATQIFEHALEGDTLAQTVMRKSAEILTYAIYNIFLILNCPLFVLGGGVGSHKALFDALNEVLQERGLCSSIRLERSSLGSGAQLVGAIEAAIDLVRSSRVSPEASTNDQ